LITGTSRLSAAARQAAVSAGLIHIGVAPCLRFASDPGLGG